VVLLVPNEYDPGGHLLKLHGFPLSNYYNMVKIALLEKGIEFELVDAHPSQDDDYLRHSPMGKVPCLETPQGFLSETNVICEYLEDTGEGPALLPTDPYERAKVRELMKEIELYIELPARSCYAEVFFGGTVSDEVKEKAKADLSKGIACLKRNGKFSPYVAGSELTYADFFFMYSIFLAGIVGKKLLDMDIYSDFGEAKELLVMLNQRKSAQQIAADQKT
jgi:glutathione S-transferase